jgi:hypothetical protein
VVLREILARSGIVGWMMLQLRDPRRQEDVVHDLASLIRTSVLPAVRAVLPPHAARRAPGHASPLAERVRHTRAAPPRLQQRLDQWGFHAAITAPAAIIDSICAVP